MVAVGAPERTGRPLDYINFPQIRMEATTLGCFFCVRWDDDCGTLPRAMVGARSAFPAG